MSVYAGLFLVSFSMLSMEISLVRLLSVTTWYHLSFFAISTAMLGMTAGAVNVFLRPGIFSREKIEHTVSRYCIFLAISIPAALVLLCLVPLSLYQSVMSLIALFVTTAACALPYFFGGTVISAVLTKYELPMGRLYASDLLGASLGCIFVLAGLYLLDAPSLILMCSAGSAAAGLFFSKRARLRRYYRRCLVLLVLFAAGGICNSMSRAGIRPVVVKGWKVQPAVYYMIERWNSFSRVAVFNKQTGPPHYWGPSPLAPQDPVELYYMNIDGEAGTSVCRYHTKKDIAHLRFDVTNVGYYLDRPGPACIIGAGGGRDVQSALLFGHKPVTGLEINPIFIDLHRNEFRDFTRLADNPDVSLVKAEARSYLSHTDKRYSVIQMSLIDTWAATGAGAFSLAENSLYTVEAWEVFLERLNENGLFTVSRWHSRTRVGEAGRIVSLAAASLFRMGVNRPRDHIALVTAGRIATLLVSRTPFTGMEVERIRQVCSDYQFTPIALPGTDPENPVIRAILNASSYEKLLDMTRDTELNYEPPTDESPYFFNMLRLKHISKAMGMYGGVIRGNVVATLTLGGLFVCLMVLTAVAVIVPLSVKSFRTGTAVPLRRIWRGALYFSLIGAAFMLVEIALIQRLTILLSHPMYALSVLLFTIIASAGTGSLVSDRLALEKRPMVYLFPIITAGTVLGVRFILSAALVHLAAGALWVKIAASVGIIFPLGFMMGMFFPTGMRLAKLADPAETPWYWALNGIFGVVCSCLAVLISIYAGISINFYIALACYALAVVPLAGLRKQARAVQSAAS